MFNFLKNLLEKASEGLAGSAGQQAVWQNAGLSETQFMAVVLLLQLSHADFDSTEQEQHYVLGYLQREYQLAPAIAQQVLAQAQAIVATDPLVTMQASELTVHEWNTR